MSSEAALDWLTENQINIFATDLHTDTYYHMANFTKPLAIVMGTESTGITNTWRNKNTHNIKVPMLGIADSLNVSTSTAIVLFECLRQRNFNQPNRQ